MGSLKTFQPAKRLAKKAQRGFRGYPVATVAFYGPDDRRASKVAVGILLREHEEPAQRRRWTSDDRDVRRRARQAGIPSRRAMTSPVGPRIAAAFTRTSIRPYRSRVADTAR